MTLPARASKLDPYGEEILTLHRQGRKLAEISKHLAQKYGLSVALSTLSEYVNRPRNTNSPPPAEPTGTPAQEMLLDQVAVYAEIQASIRVLVEEVQSLRDALPELGQLEGRFDSLSRQIRAIQVATPPAPLRRTYGEGERYGESSGTSYGENASVGASDTRGTSTNEQKNNGWGGGWSSSSQPGGGTWNNHYNYGRGSGSGTSESQGTSRSRGSNWGENRGASNDRSWNRGVNEVIDYALQPGEFSRLRKGGPENRLLVDGIVFQGGRVWRHSHSTWLPCVFLQR